MRIRQIKPDFWMDEVVSSLSLPARLLYIGLWQVADDGGFLRWNLVRIGAELFPYESAKWRAARLPALADELLTAERVRVLDCGHAVIPTLRAHQHPSKPVLTVEKEHTRDCPRKSPDTRGSPDIPANPLPVKVKGKVNVNVEGGEGGPASEPVGSLAAAPVFPPIGSRA